jgi:hypothetical protein
LASTDEPLAVEADAEDAGAARRADDGVVLTGFST